MANWSVRKRDGVWVVLDRAKKLRYAAADYHMALSFALMQGEPKPRFVGFMKDGATSYIDHPFPMWRDAIMRALEQTDYKEDEDE